MTLHLSSSQLFVASFAVSHIIYQLSVYYYTVRTMQPRSRVRHPFGLSIPFLLIPLFYTFLTGEVTTASYKIILFLSPFLAGMLLYQGSFLRHVENTMFVLLYAGCIELTMGIAYYLVNYSLGLELNISSNTIAPENDPVRLFLFIFPPVIVQTIFTPFAVLLWNNYIQKMNLHILFKLGLVAFFIGTGVLYVFPEHMGAAGWFFVFAGIFLSSVLFFQSARELQRILKNFHVHRKKQKILEQNMSDFDQLRKKTFLLRKQHHDVTGHLQVISRLLKEGRSDEARKYIQHFL